MSTEEYWGLSLDDIAEPIWEIPNHAIGSHYIAFEGDRATARQKMIDAFTAVIDKQLYRANSYGSPWHEGDDAE